jgi:hypothetical protein
MCFSSAIDLCRLKGSIGFRLAGVAAAHPNAGSDRFAARIVRGFSPNPNIAIGKASFERKPRAPSTRCGPPSAALSTSSRQQSARTCSPRQGMIQTDGIKL